MHKLFTLLTFIVAMPVAAADDLAVRFAARPAATSVALSPLGDKIVYIGAYKTGGKAVYVADLRTGDSHVMLAGATLELRPSECGFKTETRLVCTVYGVASFGASNASYSRIVAIDIDGRNMKMLTQRTGFRTEASFGGGSVLNWLPDDPDHILMQVEIGYTETVGSLIKAPDAGVGAAIVDIRTGTQRLIEKSNAKVGSLDADGQGNVRLRATIAADADGVLRDRYAWSVRAKGSRDWQSLARTTISDARAMSFDGFDEGGDHVYALASQDGRRALFAVATDGTGARSVVYARDDVDVEGVERIGKYRRPVGAVFATDRSRVHYFDIELSKLSASLARALPGHPDISVEDESWDGTKKLVRADGDSTPGRYYLYDATTRKLGELVAVYPSLDGVALGRQTEVSYAARDGTMIPGFLTLPPGKTDAHGLAGIVMPHGGPSARDSAGFDWLAQFFAAQGFVVLQPNYRGSSGYGDAFAAQNAYRSWPLAIGDVNDGGRWLVAQGVNAKKLAIVGWSYGGYAALQANVVEPTLYRATIAIAPVTDLELRRTEAQRNGTFKVIDGQIGNGPHVFAGSPARHAQAFVAPVLMFHGDRDVNVEIEQSRFMASQLRGAGKKVELVEYRNLDHQLDDSEARTQLLAKSAAFLRAAIN